MPQPTLARLFLKVEFWDPTFRRLYGGGPWELHNSLDELNEDFYSAAAEAPFCNLRALTAQSHIQSGVYAASRRSARGLASRYAR